MKKKSCRCCQGSGKELDHKAVGAEMKKVRNAAGLSQAALGKRMNFSSAYLCDLEQGYRNWTEALIERFRKACEK